MKTIVFCSSSIWYRWGKLFSSMAVAKDYELKNYLWTIIINVYCLVDVNLLCNVDKALLDHQFILLFSAQR